MSKLPLLVPFFAVLLNACSSGSDEIVEEPVTSPANPPGLISGDDSGNQLSAANYEAVVTTGMNLLRANYFPETVSLLEQLAEQWGHMRDAVVGSAVFNCPQGGLVTRDVSQAPNLPEAGLPDLITKTSLEFESCALNGSSLSGQVQWDWDESSPTQLSATNYHNYYRFNTVTISRSSDERRLDGTHERWVTIAGVGDSYTVKSVTDSFVEDANGSISSVSNGNYNQQFSHFIAQSDQANSVRHEFSEAGSATLKIDTLGLVGAMINVEPEILYATAQTTDSVTHTSRLASGRLGITLPGNASLEMTPDTGSADTVRYVITDREQQETVIEREWLAPATCRNDKDFNYGAC